MTVLLVLHEIPKREILYAVWLCLVFMLCAALSGFFRWRTHLQKLSELEASVTLSLQELPFPENPVEQQYQTLLHLLLEDKKRLECRMLSREQDMAAYYTMWVHQIKTPIAALKLLLEGHEEKEERKEALAELFRIEQYVEMALQYMRLGSETTDFVFRQVPLDDVISQAVRKYARMFIRKKIRLNYEGVKKTVLTDEKWMGFVIEQLLSNALKYTPKGSISIYWEVDALVIADTGIGIRKEDLPRVCEMGYTGYNGHADQRSTGLGLYLCSRTLKKLGHGFTITAGAEGGTCVAIRFSENQ